jgi:hypothetical protein
MNHDLRDPLRGMNLLIVTALGAGCGLLVCIYGVISYVMGW